MAVLPIVKHPAGVLRRKARPVQKVNAGVRQLLDDMAETMYAAPGIGLAAPQVGVSKRTIVVDCGEPHGLIELVNPEIVRAEGEQVGTEGCLSIPGYTGEVARHATVQVTGLNRHGRRIWIDADQRLAVCLQHEIDHLDGILYIDKARKVWEVPADAAPVEGAAHAPGGAIGVDAAAGAAAGPSLPSQGAGEG